MGMDQQHGVSNRFMKALTAFDSKHKASEKTKAMDEKYGVSARAGAGWRGITSYFERASNTPTGQRIRAFYDQGQKQVMDVHQVQLRRRRWQVPMPARPVHLLWLLEGLLEFNGRPECAHLVTMMILFSGKRFMIPAVLPRRSQIANERQISHKSDSSVNKK